MSEKFLEEAAMGRHTEEGARFLWVDIGWQGKDKATVEEKEETGPYQQVTERKEERRMPGKEGGSHNESFAFGDRHFICSPCVSALVPPPPDLSGAPPGLVTPSEAEMNQKKSRLAAGRVSGWGWLPEARAAVHPQARSRDSSRVSWA